METDGHIPNTIGSDLPGCRTNEQSSIFHSDEENLETSWKITLQLVLSFAFSASSSSLDQSKQEPSGHNTQETLY